MAMEFLRPTHLTDVRWIAIEQHCARVRNQLAGDHSGTVGVCKELIECVAKIVLEEAPAPEVADFPKLVKKASTVLGGATPRTDGDEQAATLAKGMTALVGAFETAAQGLSELRNDHGSGHGRAYVPVIADEDVQLILAYTHAWVTWALARLERLLANSVTALIAELTDATFRKGRLRERMGAVGFETIGDEEQERLGFAVAERGGRRDTFVVAADGLEPLGEDGTWPLAYQYGVAKGLLLTAHGTIRPIRLDILGAILSRLTEEMQERLLDESEGAQVSMAISGDASQRTDIGLAMLGIQDVVREPLRHRWVALAHRIPDPQ